MKKLIAVLLIALLAVAAVAGCGGKKDPGSTGNTAGGGGSPVVTPPSTAKVSCSDSYSAFLTAKTAFLDGLTKAMERNPDLTMAAMDFLGAAMADVAIIPLTVMGTDQASATAAMALFGMAGVELKVNGNTSTITYKSKEGKALSLTATYDAKTDSVTTTAKEGAELTAIFEYTRVGKGYAAQYYLKQSEGSFMLVRLQFTGLNGTVVFRSKQTDQPASIYQKTSVGDDFTGGDGNRYAITDGKGTARYGGKDYAF